MLDTNPLRTLFERSVFTMGQEENQYFALVAAQLVKQFSPNKALDIGCYTGELVHALKQLAVETYGVDISENALSHAIEPVRGALSQVDVDFRPLPFADKTFDLVIAHQILQHLQRPGYLISEMWRVLKSGGIAFIMTPTPPFETLWWRTLGIQRDTEHINDHSRRVWIKAFELNGFSYIGHLRQTVQKAAYMNLDPPTFWLGRLLTKAGPVGRWFWGWLAGYIRGTFLFKAEQFHPDAVRLAATLIQQE